MDDKDQSLNIMEDDLSNLSPDCSKFVTFGETMIRDTPADNERPERTRLVHLSMAGSEYTLAIALSRLGIQTTYITRVPENPYGRAIRDIARSQGINTDFFVWAPKTEPIGRFIYEIGCTPRKDVGIYQRMYSAASRFGAGMVDWNKALKGACLFHTSGITFGLSTHSRYERNYAYEAFIEAVNYKPKDCLVGLDFNYRATLWSREQAKEVMTPLTQNYVDVLITTIEDMAMIYNIGCGQYSAQQIIAGDINRFEDKDIQVFARNVMDLLGVKILAITIRYPDSFEEHHWESAAMDADGNYFRSPAIKGIVLSDRLGGGDTWNAGFYYGLITSKCTAEGIKKGVFVGDAFTRLQQTLMFDLPIVDKREIQSLLDEDVYGGGKRTSR
jgi:2-dehydro-3-deoxygluconokinase